MAKLMLVPLDMTTDAEELLTFVADAARGGGATVRLLHVAPVPDNVTDADGRVIAYVDQEMARLENEALDYLRTVEARLDGVPVDSVVRFGDPADEILAEADGFGADLIALTVRRGHRLSRLVLGGTVDQVCRRARASVLLFRAGDDA
jgi:nucleotide-binding universal stress UspA family protein